MSGNNNKYSRNFDEHSQHSNQEFFDLAHGREDEFLEAYPVLRIAEGDLDDLYQDIKKRMNSDGLVKAPANRSYPIISRRWGDLEVTYDKDGKRKSQHKQITWTCSHIVKVWNGDLPKVLGLEVSHLCHNPSCCLDNHLVWEFHGRNMRRNECAAKGYCCCACAIKCLINVHS
jgi:Zinc-binding loop region of homing endonuclease